MCNPKLSIKSVEKEAAAATAVKEKKTRRILDAYLCVPILVVGIRSVRQYFYIQ